MALYAVMPGPGALSLGVLALGAFIVQAAFGLRGLAGKALLALGGGLTGLLVGELCVARWAPVDLQRLEPTADSAARAPYAPDPDLGVALSADLEAVFTHPEYGRETLRTNGRGFRGPDWDEASPAAAPRVALVGDSMTVGFGVEFADTIGARLEALLRTAYPGARVMNVAVPGYGPSHGAVLLERHLDALAPDLVVHLFYDGNDLQNCREHRAYTSRGGAPPERGWLERRPPSLLSPAYWARRSAIGRRVAAWRLDRASRRRTLRHRILEDILHVTRAVPADDVLEDLAHAEASVDAMAALCEAAGSRFLLARLPTSVQAELDGFRSLLERYALPADSHDRELPGALLLSASQGRGIATLDLLGDLTTEQGLSPYYFVEGHLNARGNDVVARGLLAGIVEARLLD